MSRWPIVAIGEVADSVDRSEAPLPGVAYRQVGVHLWGEGAYERESMDGADTKYKTLNCVKAGDIIVNRIWARNGSVSVVTPSLEGCFCSGEFPLFRPRPERLDPQWFYWITKTRWFWEACDRQSRGTSGKNRLRPQRFLEITIPLAPIEEQRRVVEKLNRLATGLTRMDRLSSRAEREHDLLLAATYRAVFRGEQPYAVEAGGLDAWASLVAQASRYTNGLRSNHNRAHPDSPKRIDGAYSLPDRWVWTTLGSVLTHLVDCVNDTPDFAPHDTGLLGLKTTNVRPFRLALNERWYVTQEDFGRWNRREAPRPGDIVLTREAPVGNACILPTEVATCLTQRLLLLRADPECVSPEYVLHFLNSPQFQEQVQGASRGATTPHVNVKDAPGFEIPLAPREEQDAIARYLNRARGRLETVGHLRFRALSEASSLLASSLGASFISETEDAPALMREDGHGSP